MALFQEKTMLERKSWHCWFESWCCCWLGKKPPPPWVTRDVVTSVGQTPSSAATSWKWMQELASLIFKMGILSTVFFGIVFWRWTKGTMYLSEKGFQESSVPLLLEMSSAILVSCKASVLPPVCEWKHMLAELGVSPVSTYQIDKWNWMSIEIQPLNK